MAGFPQQQRHRLKLNQYLKSHSQPRDLDLDLNETSTSVHTGSAAMKGSTRSQQHRSISTTGRVGSQGNAVNQVKLPRISQVPGSKRKATIESLPNEILTIIFWKLQVSDVIMASRVCKRWHHVAGDNLLWKRYFVQFVGPTDREQEANTPVQNLDSNFWKNLCLKRCKVKRDQLYLKKWKQPDSYTGLKQRPELTLGKIGVGFDLSFMNGQGLEHSIPHSDLYWLTMSSTVRWYDLVFPEVKDVHCIRVYARSPLMFYGPSKPARDGITQKSLLIECKVNLKDQLRKLRPLGGDNLLELFELADGLILGRYRADGEIAFVTLSLHYHHLISRCLCGSAHRRWSLPCLRKVEDDIDPEYGLHDFTCILIIRNMRQKLLECKFTHLHTTRKALGGGYASFSPVKKDEKMSHTACIKAICFPWKTTLFKGIIQDVGILDVTVLEEGGDPFWTASSAIRVEQSSQTSQFDFDPGLYQTIHYQDDKGKIDLEIGMLEDGLQYLCHAVISLSVSAINEVFRTKY